MPLITAIELDGDTCAIARTMVRGRGVTVSAAEVLNPTSFPGTDAFVAALRKTRRTLRLPRRSRVVLWGLPDGASPKDPGAAAALAPLTAAGFKVERVVTPCNALGALARLKITRGEDATCWVAINTGSVAIVSVRPGQLIYARSFGWDSSVGSSGSQARLLQRYSLVSFLSPEVKRAMSAARAIGYPVRAVVTCGNLPDLRSMTMPLIEELDTEVETLDSFDGLDVNPPATERLMEIAAAIRLACAGVVARKTRPWDDSKRAAAHRTAALIRVAAVLAILAVLGGGYMAYEFWRTARTAPAPVTKTSQAAPPAGRGAPPITSPPPGRTPSPVPASRGPVVPAPAATPSGTPQTARVPDPKRQPAPAPPPARSAQPPPAQRAESPAVPAVSPPQNQPPPIVTAPPPTPLPASPSLQIEPRYSPAPRPRPEPLKDPLPRVTAILVSNDRRLATINGGVIVGVGDSIGRRVVVGIDERALILREPSGVRVRVGLGGRS
jgi:hypothetical protein